VSESLSASANYLRKLVEGKGDTSSNSKKEKVKEEKVQTEASTVSVHADASYSDVLKGFTTYDSKDIDTDAYSVKRQAYDAVRQKYPNLDDLIRDEKVKAMKELRSVGFRYYSIQVIAFVEIDGMTKTVSSKSHHRLERPSKDYLESILTDTFKGTIRVEANETSKTLKDTFGDGSPDV
jgi:DNA polymerase III delta prime subunit